MKESINYYYNLNISEVISYEKIYYFKIDKIIFYLVPINRDKSEINDLINVSRELKAKGMLVHDIILNRFSSVVTNINNINYILLRPLTDIEEEYSIKDITKLNNSLTLTPSKSKLYRNSWVNLWSSKVDYFEYQIRELGKDKEIILNSFSYYIGLAENAISYANNTVSTKPFTNKDKICLAHRRINYPNYALNYLNPVSFIFDLAIRDIAEFIKSSFFAGENALNSLQEALKLNNYSIYSLELLYARLLYPSYYFDIYEKVINDELKEEDLIPIIDKSKEYEEFLAEAYFEISKYAPITRVEWLLKKL